jgi:murein DD-endopeptidase MepM/ murein hydrolase activator NlpD
MKKHLLFLVLFAVSVLFSAADGFIRIYQENNIDNSFTLFADNEAFCPVYIHLTFSVLNNLSTNLEAPPYEFVIPPRSSRNILLVLNPINRREVTQFKYSFSDFLGDPFNTTPDKSHLYLFPFAHGARFEVTQGFYGTFSHFGNLQYAVDFRMPEGTPIHAARAGIIVDIKKDSNIGGNNFRYWDDANYIVIYHSDGTFGSYLHLRYNGVIVAVGQEVRAGQKIGYSGKTGFYEFPHLHFSVSVPQRNNDRMSVLFQFLSHNNEGIVPQRDQLYESIHP